jgi:hypothetical protein
VIRPVDAAGRGGLLRLVASQVAAVVAVTAVLTATFAWLGPDHGGPAADRTTAADSAPPATRPAESRTASPPGTSPAAPSSAAVPRSPSSSAPSPTVSKGPKIVVLNQSRRTGLAGRVAARLRAAGWTVSRTGDFAGTVSTTTVYYPTGLAAAARRVAAALPGPPRVKKRFASLSGNQLTVVLTSDYPG